MCENKISENKKYRNNNIEIIRVFEQKAHFGTKTCYDTNKVCSKACKLDHSRLICIIFNNETKVNRFNFNNRPWCWIRNEECIQL